MTPKGPAEEAKVLKDEVDREDYKGLHGYPIRSESEEIEEILPGMAGRRAESDGADFDARADEKTQNRRMRSVEKAIRRSCRYFFETQAPEGYWWAELESNTTITSEYIMFFYLLGCVDPRKERSMVRYLLNEQLADGSWGLYYGDEGELSTTVEAYFALKLAGEDPASEPMRKARDFILANGGVKNARVFTKIWLAMFGQYDWDDLPSMPVEMVLLPPSFPFSIYEMSSWARSTVVPLAIIMDMRPVQDLPLDKGIPELHLAEEHDQGCSPPSFTHRFFNFADRCLKVFEKLPLRFFRRKAIRYAEKWILDHQEETGDWGGIQPPMVYGALAVYYLGYPLNHPVLVKGMKALEDFCVEDDRGLRLQSCISPVWDTALTSMALMDAGIPSTHPAVHKATGWLLKHQITSGGDWQVKNDCKPGGWAFEFVNNFYPDVDDSAVILSVLERLEPEQHEGLEVSKTRGLKWCVSMQSTCGGWAAFDRDNTMMVLNRIPFGDHEAMVDYPTADITGRLLDTMAAYGYDRAHLRVQKAIRFIRELQEPDGCWWGRWGVNYIYGTWCVLRGLAAIGEDPRSRYIQAAVQWLKEHQNPDGGWGETCESYERPELRGRGESTPSQTAWALMALLDGGEERSEAVERGVDYLMRSQQPDGAWKELHFTGTGFPKNFYIRYDNYRNCFPLMALGRYYHKVKPMSGRV